MPLKSINIPNLAGGLNLQDSPLLLDVQETTSAEGVYYSGNRVIRERGVAEFGGSFSGRAQLLYNMVKSDASEYLLLFTTDYIYVYNSTTEEWDKISDGYKTTETAGAASGTNVLTVADTTTVGNGDAKIAIGNKVVIELDNGTWQSNTVSGVTDDTDITLTDNLTDDVAIGNVIFRPRELTHTTANAVDVSYWEYKEKLYITNNVDRPLEFDGVTCEKMLTLPTTTFICKALLIYRDRLFLVNSTEDGTAYNQRIRWCKSLDPDVWDSTVDPDAGSNDFYDVPEHLLAIKELNDMLIIYREFSILRGQYVGSPTLLLSWKDVISKESALSYNAVFKDKTKHIVIGEEDIFSYTGGYIIESLSEKIHDFMHSLLSNIRTSNVWEAYAFKQPDLQEYWFCFTTQGVASVYKYNVITKVWSVASYSGVLNAVGVYRDTHELTIDEVEDTIESYPYTIDDAFLARERNRIMFDNDEQLLAYDIVNTEFDTVAIDFDLQTKDFTAESLKARTIRVDHLRVNLLASAGIDIHYSTDSGATWAIYQETVTGTLATMTDVYKQIIVDKIRFKFSGNDPSFQLGKITIYYIIEEEEN